MVSGGKEMNLGKKSKKGLNNAYLNWLRDWQFDEKIRHFEDEV